jgi:Sec-independent protein secretion pathway component TatC
VKFVPRLEYIFELYVRSLLAMVAVFQIPTLAFFLGKLRVVTARFLWRNIKYSVLIIFIVAAILTPSSDPWNMAVFAAPMLALYLIGIVVAWLAEPKRRNHAGLRLVLTAAVMDVSAFVSLRYLADTGAFCTPPITRTRNISMSRYGDIKLCRV